jgi:ATP synthase protein I
MNVATRIARLQVAIAVMMSVLWGFASGPMPGLAALTGGMIAAALTFYAGVRVFGAAARDPHDMVRAFMRAQARKWILAIVLFTIALQGFASHALPLIAGFIAALVVYWFALLWD